MIEVTDDGEGLDLGAVVGGACLSALELFTDLGHGELTVHAVPGTGTSVRSRLGGCRTPDDSTATTGATSAWSEPAPRQG